MEKIGRSSCESVEKKTTSGMSKGVRDQSVIFYWPFSSTGAACHIMDAAKLSDTQTAK